MECHLRQLAEHSAIMVVALERLERLAIASDQSLAPPTARQPPLEPRPARLTDPRIDPGMGDDHRRLVATRTHGAARYYADEIGQ